jgi:hypothetical protein
MASSGWRARKSYSCSVYNMGSFRIRGTMAVQPLAEAEELEVPWRANGVSQP